MSQLIQDKAGLVKMLIDHTPIAYVILDRHYRIHYINESFATLRQLDMKTTIGNRCYNLSNGGVRCRQCAVAKAIATGEQAFLTRKDVLQNGKIRFIDDYAIPLQLDAEGKVEFVLEIMIDRTAEMLMREQRNADYDEILAILTTLLAAKDGYTAKHSENVRKLSLNFARALGLSTDEVFEISVAASLHDIGKVQIADQIINKNGKLTEQEYSKMKTHPVKSYNMLEGLTSFGKIRDIARHHHERMDGRGYPDGLSGDEISIGSKIVAIADTYDAITTTRSYRVANTHDHALQEMRRVSGSQLDTKLVEAFAEMDFDHLVDSAYDISEGKPGVQVERVITQVENTEVETAMATLSNIDLQNLFDAIFRATPCGYLLMDTDREARYASDFFLQYMGLQEDQLLGKKCYQAIGMGSIACENCAVERALKTGKMEYMRQEMLRYSEHKIFDVYGVPLHDASGRVDHVIEIIIDRTEEVQLQRAREQDFSQLIEMLEGVFTRYQNNLQEEQLSTKIKTLCQRLEELRNK